MVEQITRNWWEKQDGREKGERVSGRNKSEEKNTGE